MLCLCSIKKSIKKNLVCSLTAIFVLWGTLNSRNAMGMVSVWDWVEHTKILPSYCKHRSREGIEGGILYPRLKPIWKHIHHYCAALYGVFKAQVEINPKTKQEWLNGADDNFHYMAKHCHPEDCVIYPELYTYWGIVLREKGDIKKAVSFFEKAKRVKPDYAKAYAELADLFISLNKNEKAEEILERGLKKKPSSRRLARMLRKLRLSH